MMKLLVSLILLPLGLFAKPQLGKNFRPGWSEGAMGYDNFHSVGNYTANGDIQSLPTANSFWQTTNLDFAGRYTLNHSWALTAGVNHTSAHTSVGNFSQTQSGIQSVRGTFEYRFDYPDADFGLEGIGIVSILSIDQGSTKPIYGDGAHGFGGNLWFLQKYNNIQVQAKGGFLYRSAGLSSLIPYEVGAHWKAGDLLLGAVGEGAWSAGPDQESELVRTSFLARTSGGSMNFRSFNPSYHFIDFQAKWNATNQFSITGGLGTTWMGKSFSQGNRYFLGINILWQVLRQSMEKNPLKNVIVKPPKAQKTPESGPLYQEEDFEKQLNR